MIDLNWQDDGFGNLIFTPQDAYEFNAAMLYDVMYDVFINQEKYCVRETFALAARICRKIHNRQ